MNGLCDVLKGHCVRSNAGLYYTNYFEFEGILEYLFSHDAEYEVMCKNAKCYVQENFEWDVIMEKFRRLVNSIG